MAFGVATLTLTSTIIKGFGSVEMLVSELYIHTTRLEIYNSQ